MVSLDVDITKLELIPGSNTIPLCEIDLQYFQDAYISSG